VITIPEDVSPAVSALVVPAAMTPGVYKVAAIMFCVSSKRSLEAEGSPRSSRAALSFDQLAVGSALTKLGAKGPRLDVGPIVGDATASLDPRPAGAAAAA
jgi:hypothetical protein